MPLDEAAVTKRWMQTLRTNSRQPAELYTLRQKAAAFFPKIDPILQKHGIPSDFRYVAIVESRLNQRAVSPRGAAGYWQLMPATARELGLRVSGRTDERFHLVKSTEAACRLLQKLYSHLGSWSLVAAAYNGGLGYVRSRTKVTNAGYYKTRFNPETGAYLYRILFFKEMFENAESYSPILPHLNMEVLTSPLPGLLPQEPGADEALEEAITLFATPVEDQETDFRLARLMSKKKAVKARPSKVKTKQGRTQSPRMTAVMRRSVGRLSREDELQAA
ncbi:lytic transglycosylase domain-containing protein [Tellurirhabdus rosea]|uniref:lytic transglycosylase domain-containing protein n=1 Tax=Tellurirhabdus rosea TaxID=2674997 RepID=UPI0022586039|nr:lytic transglycosylase domain-containing protein [Tellurirhabdus rosea]